MFYHAQEPDHRRQLRDSVADFITRSVKSGDLRADIGSDIGFSSKRWKEMAELGWTSVILPEASGGLGMKIADLAAIHHEVGRAALPEPLTIVPLVAQALALGSNADLAARLIPGLIAGERIGTLAWQGPRGAIGPHDAGPEAKLDGDGWRLSGKARFVACASAATGAVVASRTEVGVALFWLEDMPPPEDATRHTDGSVQATLCVDGLRIGPDSLIAPPDRGSTILSEILDIGRLAASAELLGLTERAFEMTLDHLRQRRQFGKPIGSFQALQHRAVDLYIQIELARSALERAVTALDGETEPLQRAVWTSAAKSRCGQAALLMIRECIQMHGAIGYTEEYDLSLYVNRALYLSAWLGNPRTHRARWAGFAPGRERLNAH